MYCPSQPRGAVLAEIERLLAQTHALPHLEARRHRDFLRFAAVIFQPECVGVRLHRFRPNGSDGVVVIGQSHGARSEKGRFQADADQLHWLVRRLAVTGHNFGAFPQHQARAQQIVDAADVDAWVEALPYFYQDAVMMEEIAATEMAAQASHRDEV